MTTTVIVTSPTSRKTRELRLSAEEVRGLYYLKERHVNDILDAAVNLDETERKLALDMLRAMIEHRRKSLS